MKEFAPTFSDDNINMWDLSNLDVGPEDAKQNDFSIRVNLEKEEIYETRIYNCRAHNNLAMKLLVKRERDTGKITAVIKMNDGSTFQRIFEKEEEFRKHVKELEEFFNPILNIEDALVTELKQYKEYEKRLTENIVEGF